MPLEAPITEHLEKVPDTAERCSDQGTFANGWFGKEILNSVTFATISFS